LSDYPKLDFLFFYFVSGDGPIKYVHHPKRKEKKGGTLGGPTPN